MKHRLVWTGGQNFLFGLNNDANYRYLKYNNMSALTIGTAGNGDQKLEWLDVVRQQVGSINYGVVQIVVHDSHVTQIEKTERVRLDKSRAKTT